MQLELENRAIPAARFLLRKRFLLIAFLFITALSLRLYHIDEPPLNFHATRQYRSLLIARGYYYESLPHLPGWKKQVARINQLRQGILEPPVMEFLASIGFRIFGGERFWIPGSLSVMFWLIGGGFLYFIAKKIANANAALFSTVFYLFLPFAVAASRSFQPDPLMVMLLLATILSILWHVEKPSLHRLLVVITLSASAIFVKPVSLFAIYTIYVLLTFDRQGIKKSITSPHFLGFFPITLLPTLGFYFYGILFTGVLREQARSSFLPQILLTRFFWQGWLNNINLVVGFTTLIGALLGLLMLRKGRPRVLLLGLWSGYALFCLVFNYHIATHDYYHLQLVPIVALSLGPLAATIIERLEDKNREWYEKAAVQSIFLLAIVLYIVTTRGLLADHKNKTKVSVAEEIGRLVNHSTRTVYLDSDYGLPLEYHGEISGEPWPLVSDLEWERLAGEEILSAEDRYKAWFSRESPEYFIVTDLQEFEQQKDLEKYLTANYPLLVNDETYLIYALQQE